MSTRRQRKVADLIQEELSDILVRKVRDPRVEGVTVTEVQVTPDLRYVDVYVSKLGQDADRKEALDGLAAAAGFLRHQLAPRIDLRFMPELRFHLDRSWEQGARIEALLGEIASERPPEAQPEDTTQAEEPEDE